MKNIMMNNVKGALLAVWCLTTVSAMATEEHSMQGDGKGDKIEALRIAFISQRLSLTPDEAQKFWPLYNQYTADMKKLRENFGMGAGKPQLTAEQSLDFEQKKLDLKKKYKTQFEAAIGKDKVNTLYSLEEEFRQQLKQMREEREGNKGK
ncbi:MAG: hypothetical protein KIS94_03020 [Chitinophagales bacterium]|nr:hypothetical protein [Chitinophagales bacterium]